MQVLYNFVSFKSLKYMKSSFPYTKILFKKNFERRNYSLQVFLTAIY